MMVKGKKAKLAERKTDLRAELLKTARRLFVTNGYDATSIREIVNQAGTSIGNCYFYFPDKAAILLAIVEETVKEIALEVESVVGDLPYGPERLALAVYSGALASLKRKDLARVAAVEAKHPKVRAIALDYFTTAIANSLRHSPGMAGDTDIDLKAYAWQGAVFNLLEGLVTGKIDRPAEEVGLFLARWNLQALGLPHKTVDNALAEVARWAAKAENQRQSKTLKKSKA